MGEIRRIFLELVVKICSPTANERELGADEVTDIADAFTPHQAHALASVLVEARLVEQDSRCQEAQLNAICELKGRHGIDSKTLSVLATLATTPLGGSQSEHLDELLKG